MRRPLLIASVIVVALGLAVGAYFYFSRNQGAGITVTPGADLPGGTGAVTGGTGGTTATSTAPGSPSAVTARLVRISAGPVVPGEVVVTRPGPNASSSPVTLVSFIDRASGNVYAYDAQAATLTRTSNKTIPGIQSAAWLPDGSAAFVRYLSGTDLATVSTYALRADGAAGFFLRQDLAGIAVSSTSLLTLASGVNGSVASVGKTDGSKASEAFSSPLAMLRVAFLGKSGYLAFTKPAASLPGAAFAVDSGGRFSRIAGPLPGLVVLPSPSGAYALVTYAENGTLATDLVTLATGESVSLPIATIADKCVWAADSSALYCGVPKSVPAGYAYPDDWYQGAASFDDRMWKIEVSGRYAQLLLDFSAEANTALDAEALAVDARGTVLVFVNRADGSLWSYSL